MTHTPLRTVVCGLCLLAAAAAPAAEPVARRAPAPKPLSAAGSERATSGAGNKIAVFDGKTHVVWQDLDAEGYMARIRTLDHATGAWSEPITLGRGTDNHARPNILVDRRGYLHVIIAGHWTGLQYRRSVRPNDASQWTDVEEFGKSTYPVMDCAPDGTIYLTARHDEWWKGVDFYVRPPGGPWQERGLVVRKGEQWQKGYGAYQTGLAVGPDGTLHMVVDFYEGTDIMKDRGKHQAVCYMASDDGGQTWRKADGTPVAVPARPEQMDVLARDTADRSHPLPPPILLSKGNIIVDADGRPHVLYLSHRTTPGAIIHATLDDRGNWQQTEVDAVARAFPTMRPIQCRGALTRGGDGAMHALLQLVTVDGRWEDGKPVRDAEFTPQEQRLVWLTSRDNGKTFSVAPALAPGTEFHEPNAARAVGGAQLPDASPPPFIFFAGHPGKNPEKAPVDNPVFIVHP